ncbi:energy transducer TonB [Lysobacter enzymogenes]|uniref:energy transducer TonB n=1 Tax=Lysobacter enzymogenes TaxID=69 RepID=UPI00099B41D6|nr:TonB family protein [Lysobacter enzymogenes]UZW58450.1 TonB family protein [Lysobacter enzymogenes]
MSPRARERWRWLCSLGAVLAVHGAAAAAALWWSAREPLRPQTLPAAAVMVELAPTPQAPPAPPRQLPPGPRQREQHRAATPPRPQPRLQAPPAADADVELPPPAPTPAPPAPADPADVAATLAPPDLPAPAATKYAAPQSVSGRRDDAVAQWQNLLLGHLEKFRRYPRQAQRLNQQGVAYVRFAVDRGGAVSQIRIGRSSGYPALDAGTLETVRLAAPVPAPPAQIQDDPVEVMVPVAFFIRGR